MENHHLIDQLLRFYHLPWPVTHSEPASAAQQARRCVLLGDALTVLDDQETRSAQPDVWALALEAVAKVASLQEEAAGGAADGRLSRYCQASHGDALCKLAQAMRISYHIVARCAMLGYALQAMRAAHGLLTEHPTNSYEAQA